MVYGKHKLNSHLDTSKKVAFAHKRCRQTMVNPKVPWFSENLYPEEKNSVFTDQKIYLFVGARPNDAGNTRVNVDKAQDKKATFISSAPAIS